MAKKTVVLARVETQSVHDGKAYAHDLGVAPGLRLVRTATTALWLNAASAPEIEAARRHAASENASLARNAASYPGVGPWQVIVLPVATRDARAVAAAQVLAVAS